MFSSNGWNNPNQTDVYFLAKTIEIEWLQVDPLNQMLDNVWKTIELKPNQFMINLSRV